RSSNRHTHSETADRRSPRDSQKLLVSVEGVSVDIRVRRLRTSFAAQRRRERTHSRQVISLRREGRRGQDGPPGRGPPLYQCTDVAEGLSRLAPFGGRAPFFSTSL